MIKSQVVIRQIVLSKQIQKKSRPGLLIERALRLLPRNINKAPAKLPRNKLVVIPLLTPAAMLLNEPHNNRLYRLEQLDVFLKSHQRHQTKKVRPQRATVSPPDDRRTTPPRTTQHHNPATPTQLAPPNPGTKRFTITSAPASAPRTASSTSAAMKLTLQPASCAASTHGFRSWSLPAHANETISGAAARAALIRPDPQGTPTNSDRTACR